MKKTILIFIVILLVIYVAVSIWDRNSEYNAERYLFKANKLLSKILQNPDSIPPALEEKTARSYKQVITKFPESLNAKRAILSLGNLYIVVEKFDKARQELQKYQTQYQDDENLAAEIEFVVGKSYEKQGQWLKARQVYDGIISNYPDSLKALEIPIYIARYFMMKQNEKEAHLAYRQAVVHYQRLARDNPDSAKGYLALSTVATCYMDQKKWSPAIDALAILIEQYPKSRELPKWIQMVGLISLGQLKSPDKAIEVYEGFILKFPEHPVAEPLAKQIEKLKTPRLE